MILIPLALVLLARKLLPEFIHRHLMLEDFQDVDAEREDDFFFIPVDFHRQVLGRFLTDAIRSEMFVIIIYQTVLAYLRDPKPLRTRKLVR